MLSSICKNQKKSRWIACLALVALALIFYWSIHDFGIFVGDDQVTAQLNQRSFQQTLQEIRDTFPVLERGRIIGNPLALLINYAQCAAQSILVFRLVNFAAIFFSVWAMFRLLRRAFHTETALCWALLFGLLIEIYHTDFCGFTSFGATYQLFIGIGILSMESLLCYFDREKTRDLWLCAILYFVACSCYESLIVLCIPMLAIAIIKLKQRNRLSFAALVRTLWIPAFGAILFLAVYYAGIKLSPNQVYSGLHISASLELPLFLKTLFRATFGNAPLLLTFIDGAEAFRHIFANLLTFSLQSLLFWAAAVLASFALTMLLYRIPRISKRLCLVLAAVSIGTAVALCVPHVLTDSYTALIAREKIWCNGISSCSYYFIILSLMFFLLWLVQKTERFQKTMRVVFVVIFSLCGYLSMASNSYFRDKANRGYYLFDEMVATPEFKERVVAEDTFLLIEFKDFYTGEPYVQKILNDNGLDHIRIAYDRGADYPDTSFLHMKRYYITQTLCVYRPDANLQSHELMLLIPNYEPTLALRLEAASGEDIVRFPLDGELYYGMEDIQIIPLESGAVMVILRTTEAWDFRFIKTL